MFAAGAGLLSRPGTPGGAFPGLVPFLTRRLVPARHPDVGFLAVLRFAALGFEEEGGPGRAEAAATPRGDHPLAGWPLDVLAHDPDADLLRAVYDEFPHSTEAYSRLVRRHWNVVYSICQAVLLQDEDAEEATQDAFLKAHRYLPSFRVDSRFLTWLSRIARNAALNRYRARKTERGARDRVAQDPGLVLSWLPWRSPQPSTRRIALREALTRLEPEDRLIVLAHDVEGVPHEEIAESLGLSHGAVRMRATRARALLRRILKDWGPGS